jgi:hypothetical protein
MKYLIIGCTILKKYFNSFYIHQIVVKFFACYIDTFIIKKRYNTNFIMWKRNSTNYKNYSGYMSFHNECPHQLMEFNKY